MSDVITPLTLEAQAASGASAATSTADYACVRLTATLDTADPRLYRTADLIVETSEVGGPWRPLAKFDRLESQKILTSRVAVVPDEQIRIVWDCREIGSNLPVTGMIFGVAGVAVPAA